MSLKIHIKRARKLILAPQKISLLAPEVQRRRKRDQRITYTLEQAQTLAIFQILICIKFTKICILTFSIMQLPFIIFKIIQFTQEQFIMIQDIRALFTTYIMIQASPIYPLKTPILQITLALIIGHPHIIIIALIITNPHLINIALIIIQHSVALFPALTQATPTILTQTALIIPIPKNTLLPTDIQAEHHQHLVSHNFSPTQ